ncbi:DUF1697 domain-containing protein [Streptomyces minutiscleroticus]|uniref:DUF1697 domain-containing protein n=1 Tax=Streptomyces minutiscleroticus TaxID=68238 RepID=UPI00331E1368
MTTTYGALLRGVNVGGRRKVPMAGLREVLRGLGHGGVRTHLQSGNAVFTTGRDDGEEALAAELAGAVGERFGFAVDVLVRDHTYLASVVDDCPFPAAELEGRQLHAVYFSGSVGPERFASLDRESFLPEEFRLGDRVLYLYAPDGLGRSKLADALSRPRLLRNTVATTRNWNTAVKLAELTRG